VGLGQKKVKDGKGEKRNFGPNPFKKQAKNAGRQSKKFTKAGPVQ